MLDTSFNVYQKGANFRNTLSDLFGQGTFLADGENWKHQRQVLSHEFNNKDFYKYFKSVVLAELNDRLVPILSNAAVTKTTLDFQDVVERFGLDTICKVACGHDEMSLLPSLPPSELGQAFHDSLRIINQRFTAFLPIIWKTKRFLNIGSEKQLRVGVTRIRNFVKENIKKKKDEYDSRKTLESLDFLSLLLVSGQSDEKFLEDMVINFILAGLESISAVLTWYFWLISGHPEVEDEIVKEIVTNEGDNLVYTQATIFESLRLYPSVPVNSREAVNDDVLPDGTKVKKGSMVSYHNYAMGRSENLWGNDWPVFKPERWLDREGDGSVRFVTRDPFCYPEFHAGPRTCMGKDMATWQMKTVVAGVFRRFRVVSELEEGVEPKFIAYFNSKMVGGLPVKIEERV